MSEEKMMEIINKIRNRRLELGMSYQDLADKTGMSKSTLQRYETGAIKNIPLDKLSVLARALDIDPAYLMGWEDNGTVPTVTYYLDDETAQIAQEVYDRPELKVLFDATRKASKEDIEFVIEMIGRMANKER